MRNVYSVRLVNQVGIEECGHHFSGKTTVFLFVVASTFHDAELAVKAKYSGAEIRSIDLMNYTGVPIVVGD